ncbi:hypothetical protein F5Y02DRAFT_373833 [Annulohypoxylon stygium]|nr:hypothetical protein F5Y02DRAFT_373833 [Annulohypoxylon stygium]
MGSLGICLGFAWQLKLNLFLSLSHSFSFLFFFLLLFASSYPSFPSFSQDHRRGEKDGACVVLTRTLPRLRCFRCVPRELVG